MNNKDRKAFMEELQSILKKRRFVNVRKLDTFRIYNRRVPMKPSFPPGIPSGGKGKFRS
jgi:hypothetical protein